MRHSFLAAAAVFTRLVSAGNGFTAKPVISGYWPSYASNLLKPENIPYDQYTHIDWFVASTKSSYDLELYGSESDLKKVVKLAHAAGVTVSMSIGGWTGSIYFSDLVANETGRTAFAESIKGYVDKFDLDGVDIDWEFPGTQGVGCNTIRPEDPDNFLEFLSILRQTLGPDARLSSAVSVSGIIGPDGKTYNRTGELANYLDYVTIMAYDIYGVYSATTGPLGALYDTCATEDGRGKSGAAAAKIWTDAGFPANKLLLGTAAYSHAYTTTSTQLSTLSAGNSSSLAYQPKANGIPKGGITSSDAGKDVCGVDFPAVASWLYRELISSGKLDSNGTDAIGAWTRTWDDCSQTPFLFNNITRELINYDDPQSYSAKAQFVRQHGLAGINMFDLTGDTSDSKLIKAARTQLIGTFGDIGSQKSFEPPAPAVRNVTSVDDAPSSAFFRTRPLPLFSFVHQALHPWR